MRAKRIASDEQFRLITECRQSGLSDFQWCQIHDIKPGTFYNWISRLRKKGYSIPEVEAEHNTPLANRQEVVKIDLIPDLSDRTALSTQVSAVNHTALEPSAPTMELSVGNTTIRLFHNADREMVETVLRYTLGGAAYAG